jgi:SnoaL-like protein
MVSGMGGGAKEADMKRSRSIFRGVLALVAAVMPAFAPAQTGGQSIEQRPQRVEDELAIGRVLVEYSARQDARDYAGYAALFAKNGDRATARSRHLLVMRGPKGEPTPALAGRYEDELIREDGQWKILRRVDYPVIPTAEEWMEFIRERKASGQ